MHIRITVPKIDANSQVDPNLDFTRTQNTGLRQNRGEILPAATKGKTDNIKFIRSSEENPQLLPIDTVTAKGSDLNLADASDAGRISDITPLFIKKSTSQWQSARALLNKSLTDRFLQSSLALTPTMEQMYRVLVQVLDEEARLIFDAVKTFMDSAFLEFGAIEPRQKSVESIYAKLVKKRAKVFDGILNQTVLSTKLFLNKEKPDQDKLLNSAQIYISARDNLQDVIGLRSILQNTDPSDLVKKIKTMIADGSLVICEMRNYHASHGKPYFSKEQLQDVQNAMNSKFRAVNAKDPITGQDLECKAFSEVKTGGYTSLHFVFGVFVERDGAGSGVRLQKFEWQVRGTVVDAISAIEHLIYKIRDLSKTEGADLSKVLKKYQRVTRGIKCVNNGLNLEEAIQRVLLNPVHKRDFEEYIRNWYKMARALENKTGDFSALDGSQSFSEYLNSQGLLLPKLPDEIIAIHPLLDLIELGKALQIRPKYFDRF